ncbi:ribosome small subunit-dependent GTPase A [Candidatus Neptunochlamydia vexilliferae]|nr:ribosome small subunit-dependent GTPase A [Candidatus Neptunochlamydia vexilliferae]
MRDDYLDYEEAFYSSGKRESRKERRQTQAKDRSKYKKTDQVKQEKTVTLGENDRRGRVLKISPDIITVTCDNTAFDCTLKGALKKEKTKQKNLIAVGDWVYFDPSQTIFHVEARTSFLRRAENLSRRKHQLIAANIDQVFIVTSLVSPKFKPLLIDRYILSAKEGNMDPIIVVNKHDLLMAPPENISADEAAAEKLVFEEFLEAYQPLDIPIVVLSVATGENLHELKALMENKTSVFSGQSGVGKTSLINAIFGSDLPIGPIALKTNKGSHTTTNAELVTLENGAFCIDTPGIKSFGLWQNDPAAILEIFPDFIPFAADCKFKTCTHIHEPECGIKKALEEKKLAPLRYASYLTLLEDTPPKEWE